MGSSYGFNDAVFFQMKAKGKEMLVEDKRGVILIDEMKLSEGIKFNSKTVFFDGFVDIGDYTPDNQKNELGDHALVMMFQPFKGSWVQPLACFLAKSCAKGAILEYLIIECLSLLENSGFYCDGIVTDATPWNRSAWNKFGISLSNVSAEHPCDKNRRLWFISDFPYLIKTLRNKLMSGAYFKTPDGWVKKEHWCNVVEEKSLNKNPFLLSIAHKLTPEHLNPKGYQKMNVPLAYQIFEKSAAAAMRIIYEELNLLEECKPTIELIYKINHLIEIMSIRDSNKGLKPKSVNYNFRIDFLDYLDKWDEAAKNSVDSEFMTDETCYGLKITIKGKIELTDYLCEKYSYDYLMTTRVNQDKLERFFGLARNVCGSNDYPDSILFGQIFRLLCTYSSLKPVKGSNVSGGEMIQSLHQFRKDETRCPDQHSQPRKEEWAKIISSILENAVEAKENEHENYALNEMEHLVYEDISHSVVYVAGYILRKIVKQSKSQCEECKKTIHPSPEELNEELYKAINLLNEGGLMYPSHKLIKLLNSIEKHILKVTNDNIIMKDTLFEISYSALDDYKPAQPVDCKEH